MPLLQVRMELPTVRYEPVGDPFEALPRHPMSLASPEQGVPPRAADLTDETFQLPEKVWARLVAK